MTFPSNNKTQPKNKQQMKNKNTVIISGPSGCGKSTLIGILKKEMKSRGYNKNRIDFVEHLSLGKRTTPSIKFIQPQGMLDFANLLSKCAGNKVGELGE